MYGLFQQGPSNFCLAFQEITPTHTYIIFHFNNPVLRFFFFFCFQKSGARRSTPPYPTNLM